MPDRAERPDLLPDGYRVTLWVRLLSRWPRLQSVVDTILGPWKGDDDGRE